MSKLSSKEPPIQNPKSKTQNPEAEALLRRHKGLIGRVVQEYAHQRGALEIADLEQEARLALWRAALAFDAGRGVQFSSYATAALRRALIGAIETQRDLIRRPPWIHRRVRRVRSVQARLAARLGREPTREEVAAEAGLPSGVVHAVEALAQAPLSLDARRDEEAEATLGDLLPAAGDTEAELLLREWARWLRCHPSLDKREQRVVALHYGFEGRPRTLAEVGKLLGISDETARKARSEALRKMRELIAAEQP